MSVDTRTTAAGGPTLRPEELDWARATLADLGFMVGSVLRGKTDVVDAALLTVLAEGHLLLDDVPGVGKTLLAKTLATAIGGRWSRVQFTPDLLPSDITGVSIWKSGSESFEFRPGPVFANVIVCDEINRGTAKVQSALLEAMEERRVTADAVTYRLPRPFLVMATQNPFEQEGTFTLPESQLDRFLIRTSVGYPDRDAEVELLSGIGGDGALGDVAPVVEPGGIARLIAAAEAVYVAPALVAYIADLVRSTRTHRHVALGMSPRGGLALMRTARATALLHGRKFATPDDVRSMLHLVGDHRILLRGHAQWDRAASHEVLDDVVSTVAVPGSRAALG